MLVVNVHLQFLNLCGNTIDRQSKVNYFIRKMGPINSHNIHKVRFNNYEFV